MSPERQPRGPEPVLTGVYLPSREPWHLIGQANDPAQGGVRTDWRLRLDPGNVGETLGWGEHGLTGETVAAEVPGVWNTTCPNYSGVAWYEATCRPNEGLLFRGTIRLVVGAANYLTDVWLNGVYLGRHEGGYDAFAFRCTDLVRRGENRVTLRIVDPPLDGEIDGLNLRTAPTAKESWYGGAGGPWGGVWFEESASVWLQDIRVRGDLVHERATFEVTVASDLAAPSTVRVHAYVGGWNDEIGPPYRASIPVDVGRQSTAMLTVPFPTPQAWSPELPTRYPWVISVEMPEAGYVDWASGSVGFRTTELRDGVFYLNGEPRYLKGALLQPTVPRTIIGPAHDYGARDIELAKGAGLNLLRCHLRPPTPGLLAACDRLGMMVYVEPPLAWIEPSGRLLEHGKRELAAMVRACANHPSVVMWGIFNENARATEAVGGDLMAELAALDPTRPIVENSGGAAVGEVGVWAWGGQSRCWSPGWEAPRPLNDVHIYLANPLRQEARELLATVGDGPMLDVTPGRPPAERIESRMAADAVLVSEYGCGALPDFEAALAAFGDEQHLADAVLLRDLRDDLTRALAERGLDRELGDVPSVVEQTQALQAEGILAQTAALRGNPRVSGIILTQLADAGWEQMAGLVGLWRHPRPAMAAFTRALQPRLLHVETDDPSTTRAFVARLHLIEEASLLRRAYEEATLHLTAEREAPAEHGRAHVDSGRVAGSDESDSAPRSPGPVTLQRSSVVLGRRLGGETITIATFAPDAPGRYRLRAHLTAEDWEVDGACTILRLPDRQPETGAGLVLLGNGLRRTLPHALDSLPTDWDDPILASLPSRPTVSSLRLAVERARAGAHLCLVGMEPAHAERLASLLDLPIRLHGARGNFMGMHHYVRDHPLFAGLGVPCLADGTFAEVLPAWALEELPGAEVLAGCFTVPDGGRAFLWRASVQTLPFGRGHLTIYQLRASHRQGGALGRHLLDTLVAWLCAGIRRSAP